MFTPQMQADMGGLEVWSDELGTSFWRELTLTDGTYTQDRVEIRMMLRTEQFAERGPESLACSDWDLTYVLLWDGELQTHLIDEVRQERDPVGCS